jgi:alcohol dehydrogenase (cytochrome c)
MRSKLSLRVCAVLSCAALFAASLAGQEITSKELLAGLANPTRWLSYSGDYSGKRFSPLTQITAANATRLAPQWTFQTGLVGHKFEGTPIAVDGTIYVAGPNNVAWAIDAKTGKQIWRYQRSLPETKLLRVCCGYVNRGFAVLGDRLFMTTLDAHLVALEMKTGKVIWDIEMAKSEDGYAGTGAPLIVKDKIITGIAGGEWPTRGFIDAYNPANGERIWRLFTVPLANEPGGDTWPGDTGERGGGSTWQSGSYDPELNLVYWGTGNPNPDFYGGDRKGDNLYTNSVLAFDPDTGKLRWHFQFTPWDEHDWDATHVPIITDMNIGGKPRKALLVGNRNGFFYVLDRTNGQYIQGRPYVKTTWSIELDKNGRPIELPNQRPTAQGTMTCPDALGGTNFFPPSFSPATGLFYISARETCATYIAVPPKAPPKPGAFALGGTQKPADRGTGALRAIDPLTMSVKWELKHALPSWAGVLSTAGNIVVTGDADGHFIVADATNGKELYRYPMGSPVYSAANTYLVDGRQHIIMGAGAVLTSFALPAGVK